MQELTIIENFLDKFIYISDSGLFKESVDLKLALKALPTKIDKANIFKIKLLNFTLIQKSLINYEFGITDELFEYYDNRSKARMRHLATQAIDSEDLSGYLKFVARNLMT